MSLCNYSTVLFKTYVEIATEMITSNLFRLSKIYFDKVDESCGDKGKTRNLNWQYVYLKL